MLAHENSNPAEMLNTIPEFDTNNISTKVYL